LTPGLFHLRVKDSLGLCFARKNPGVDMTVNLVRIKIRLEFCATNAEYSYPMGHHQGCKL